MQEHGSIHIECSPLFDSHFWIPWHARSWRTQVFQLGPGDLRCCPETIAAKRGQAQESVYMHPGTKNVVYTCSIHRVSETEGFRCRPINIVRQSCRNQHVRKQFMYIHVSSCAKGHLAHHRRAKKLPGPAPLLRPLGTVSWHQTWPCCLGSSKAEVDYFPTPNKGCRMLPPPSQGTGIQYNIYNYKTQQKKCIEQCAAVVPLMSIHSSLSPSCCRACRATIVCPEQPPSQSCCSKRKPDPLVPKQLHLVLLVIKDHVMPQLCNATATSTQAREKPSLFSRSAASGTRASGPQSVMERGRATANLLKH